MVVLCDVGRGAVMTPSEDGECWQTVYMNAADFSTLGWTHEMEPLQLWRLFRMSKQLRDMGVFLVNMNGLLESEPNRGRSVHAARRALGEFATAEVLVNTASFLTENSSLRTATLTCARQCAPSSVHRICCFFAMRWDHQVHRGLGNAAADR